MLFLFLFGQLNEYDKCLCEVQYAKPLYPRTLEVKQMEDGMGKWLLKSPNELRFDTL